jgi:hypothetical protein
VKPHEQEPNVFYRKVFVFLVFGLMLSVAVVSLVKLRGDNKGDSEMFFPLRAESRWTYSVDSQSQQQKYLVVDVAKGFSYVGKLHRRCLIVDETYNLERGGTRPVIYYPSAGYLNRMSGLQYNGDEIEFPAWTLAEEKHFLPLGMRANGTWSNVIRPFGNLNSAPVISQSHKSFAEPQEIVVPAGKFRDCLRVETTARFTGGAYREPLILQYFDWYAPDVGLVKTIARETDRNGRIVEDVELIEFRGPRAYLAKSR